MSNFVCVWVSPRGFANEGNYIYGPEAKVLKSVEWTDRNPNAFHAVLSRHKTLKDARLMAERRVRSKDTKKTGVENHTSAVELKA